MIKSIYASLLCLCLSMLSPAFAELPQSTALTPQVSVAGQMNLDKFSALLKQGFKSVIVNRPDQENGNLVSVSQLREVAEKAHVSVIYQPVDSGKISQTDIQEFAKYYNELTKPILLVCRSGTLSTALFNQAKAQGLLNE
ncbi:hypothetical protein HYG93_12280 [Acinetobacter sp. SwsAc6]|jgi:uncharacterized protein (TIGR01244 family)|uniref:beta-lactamase hydrolase domain-containing protein n=1 Tax=Acinetobacter TaxID=469 RepID=UPI000D13DCAF|nr:MULTISPECIES: sulfur transferase domain-containing protein [Acinetobacter]NWK75032.1 hypothetical protein [Acinetobacter sp. SwsAc6]QCO20310.1 hypothetical protein C9E88_001590 [Acinetobacter cumulans]